MSGLRGAGAAWAAGCAVGWTSWRAIDGVAARPIQAAITIVVRWTRMIFSIAGHLFL